ncbi:TPA: glycosyltransferase family 2 protein [Providencia alcalifaciens]
MKISIIIATYNAQEYIDSCLNSIAKTIKDNPENLEVIIIDGKSTDSTCEIIQKHSNFISFFLSEKDNGIYDAWNKGIKKSKGDWIMFLGADDQLEQGGLEKYLSIIDEIPSKIEYISSKVKLIDSNKKTIRIIGQEYDWNKFKHYMNVVHVASLHKRTLFQDIGLYDTSFKICGDYELLLRRRNSLQAFFLDEIIASMQIGGISYQSKISLLEAKKAKIKNHSVSLISAELDYNFSYLKLLIKKLINYKS